LYYSKLNNRYIIIRWRIVLASITFGAVTRGTGKIFILLETQIPENATLTSYSKTSTNKTIPTALIPLDKKNQFVLVLPILTVNQTVTVQAHDANKQVLAIAEKVFKHGLSAAKSKLNTLFRNSNALRIRNIDSKLSASESNLTVNNIVDNENNTDTVICTAETFSPLKKLIESAFEIRVLDLRGNTASLNKATLLRDNLESYPSLPNGAIRQIQFSFKVSTKLQSFIIWLHYTVSLAPDGFLCLEDFRAKDLRDSWLTQINRNPISDYYEDWFVKTHRTSLLELDIQRLSTFPYMPFFSIIVPIYNTPISFFEEMINSVLVQTYKNFELILVNASPKNEALNNAIKKASSLDKRIKIISLAENLGITLNTNEGMKAAAGDFICFLDHDDVIEPDTLFEYAKAANEHPDTDLIYCDEDKLQNNHYKDGFLKPDFNWDYLFSCNFVCHMLAVRRSLIDFNNLPGKEMDGAQDWNLTFITAEKARNIFHVRKILYHWRIHPESTASGIEAKPWVINAQLKAVQGHLDRCGIQAHVLRSPTIPDFLQVNYAISTNPKISIIIPNKDAIHMLNQCISSILNKSTYKNYEIIIVENNSTDSSTFSFYHKIESRYSQIKVVFYKGSWNFSKIINFGSKHANGDFFLFLNNDTEVISPNWLELMLGPCMRSEVGIVGAKLLYANGLTQHMGVHMSDGGPGHTCMLFPDNDHGYFNLAAVPHAVSAVTGACLLVKQEVYNKIGGLDETLAVNYNDVDFCLKCNAIGKYVIIQPQAKLYHYESVSRGASDRTTVQAVQWCREKAIMMNRWANYYVKGDPYYNCNLARGLGSYQLS
jgi:GT2 family glycosyltransferase